MQAGADLFAVDDGGMTPLHAACHAKNSELAGGSGGGGDDSDRRGGVCEWVHVTITCSVCVF